MAGSSLANNRRLYLCTYDVASDREGDRRRSRLFNLLQDHGEHVQFSVFLCELTKSEHSRLLASSRDILHQTADQLLVLDIGPEGLDWPTKLSCLGKSWTPSVRSFIV